MPAPYVNVIGPGEHEYINSFDMQKVYYVNRYHNTPQFSFPKQDYRQKIDYRFG